MERMLTLRTRCSCPCSISGRSHGALPTWWRGWRRMRRLTGGGEQPPRQHPCPRHCGSGARSPSSESASAPPGPSGSQSGPSESLSVSWGKGQETLGSDVLASFICCPSQDASVVQILHPIPTKGPNTKIHPNMKIPRRKTLSNDKYFCCSTKFSHTGPGKDRASRLAQDRSESNPNRKVKSGTNKIRLQCPNAQETRPHQESRGHPLNYQVPPWHHLALCYGTGQLPLWTPLEPDPSFHKIIYEEMSSHTHSSIFYTACQNILSADRALPLHSMQISSILLHRILPKLPFPFWKQTSLEAHLQELLTDYQEPASRLARLGH